MNRWDWFQLESPIQPHNRCWTLLLLYHPQTPPYPHLRKGRRSSIHHPLYHWRQGLRPIKRILSHNIDHCRTFVASSYCTSSQLRNSPVLSSTMLIIHYNWPHLCYLRICWLASIVDDNTNWRCKLEATTSNRPTILIMIEEPWKE